jgi:hypothetical protein
LLTQLLFDESAAAYGSLKLSHRTHVLGAPIRQPGHAGTVETGDTADVIGISQSPQRPEKLILCQTSQFCDGLTQAISGGISQAVTDPGAQPSA